MYRKKFDIPVIGITGSCGKTTTKEMLAHKKDAAPKEEAVMTLSGVRKIPEESKVAPDSHLLQKPKTESNETKDVMKRIKDKIMASSKPDTLKSLLNDGAPKPTDQDDFMTRCAHRGLH